MEEERTTIWMTNIVQEYANRRRQYSLSQLRAEGDDSLVWLNFCDEFAYRGAYDDQNDPLYDCFDEKWREATGENYDNYNLDVTAGVNFLLSNGIVPVGWHEAPEDKP